MTAWAWMRTDKPTGSVDWVTGTLEQSYARVSRDGGTWILYSADPLDEFYRVMHATKLNS